MKEVIIENGNENRETLTKRNDSKRVLILHPPKLGKAQMVAIASALKGVTGATITQGKLGGDVLPIYNN